MILKFMVSCFVEMCALWVRIGSSGLMKGLVMGIWKGDPRVCGADRKWWSNTRFLEGGPRSCGAYDMFFFDGHNREGRSPVLRG